jgi:hypothetical protein
VRSVEAHLTEAFKEKSEGGRILDLWMDMPTANPNHNTGYISQNFEKLDKDFMAMSKA